MYNFTFYTPTKIHFGKDQISHLAELKESGSKALLVYGGGSIKRSGLYDDAVAILKDAGITVYELPGIEPNPRIQSVRKGVEMCKAEGIGMVLAIGGGSTIDAAKVIAAGAVYDGDAWDLVLDPGRIKGALPIFSVLTLAATGSEMDMVAVISDMTKNEKWGTRNPHMSPTMSILDPTYTYSVSKKQTAAGTADMMSHTMENFFSMAVEAEIQTQFAEGILRTCIKYGPIALAEPDNYEARANLMWAASHAINGLCGCGISPGWGMHAMEHELSAFYDITHGEGLAILTPVWMEYVLGGKAASAPAGSELHTKVVAKFARYGRNVFGLDPLKEQADEEVAKMAIECLRKFFFETMHIPANMRAVGIEDEDNFEIMAQKASCGGARWFVPLTKEDVVEIFRAAK
jgi:alcohol dehydrogenase YqhD (iron-dependent ADH family)